jgi:hypothetical protein
MGKGVALRWISFRTPTTGLFRMLASAGVDRLKIDRTKKIRTDYFSAPAAWCLPPNTPRLLGTTRGPSYLTQVDCKGPFEITADCTVQSQSLAQGNRGRSKI